MHKPVDIPIEQYNYPLPDHRIARYPLEDRDRSKLLFYRDGKIDEHRFSDVPGMFDTGNQLYFNSTRVVQARLAFRKQTGARIEIFCLEPFEPHDYQLAFSSTGPVAFVCLVGNAKRWKGEELYLQVGETVLSANLLARKEDKFIVQFSWKDTGISFGMILERTGTTPIPPYLKRDAERRDVETYQTIYAQQDGSVAAPTAGLHFTKNVLEALERKGVQRHELILHVGAGTFIPVKEENAADHRMHAELVSVNRQLLESLLTEQRIIAVGTTTTRSLESIYWLGVMASTNSSFSFENLYLDQWDAYEMEDILPLKRSIGILLERMDTAGIDAFSFRTRIMITPGYRFRVIEGLFTNFHQPKSTLLLLVAAVVGDDWRKIYGYALENNFRFLSYGDSSLLLTTATAR
jgi:S-adenosylmethionine:tRNA ribosyltransferase-isomerase